MSRDDDDVVRDLPDQLIEGLRHRSLQDPPRHMETSLLQRLGCRPEILFAPFLDFNIRVDVLPIMH